MGVKDTLSPTEESSSSEIASRRALKGRQMPLKRQDWPRIRDTKKESSKSRYVVDLRPHVYGKGSRLYFDNLEAAKLKAKELATENKNKGVEAIDFPTDLRVEATTCNALLLPFGASLRQAVDHYLAWLKTERHRNGRRSVAECVDDYLATREMHLKTGEISPITMREIRTRAKQFKAAWGGKPIMSITRVTVKEYLENQQAAGMKPRSRINIRANMTAFFNHCLERGWIDHSPCVRIKIKVGENDVSILTIEQTRALMKAASESRHADKMVPYFAICLFAGLRPTEATRLDWSRIRFEDGRIEILKDTTKTRRRRWAKIEPNGLEWLRPYARPSGLILGGISAMTWKRQFNAVRIAAGLIPDPEAEAAEDAPKALSLWDQDIMRHSFASYLLAVNKNAPELAESWATPFPSSGSTTRTLSWRRWPAHFGRSIPNS